MTDSDETTLFADARPEDAVSSDEDSEDTSDDSDGDSDETAAGVVYDISDLKPLYETDWDKDEDPLVWLFSKSARANLCSFAVRQSMRDDDVPYINKSAVARESDVSRHSVQRYINDMVDLGIFDARGHGYNRYRANADSRLVQALAQLRVEIIGTE